MPATRELESLCMHSRHEERAMEQARRKRAVGEIIQSKDTHGRRSMGPVVRQVWIRIYRLVWLCLRAGMKN
jgi:hypothetical protein